MKHANAQLQAKLAAAVKALSEISEVVEARASADAWTAWCEKHDSRKYAADDSRAYALGWVGGIAKHALRELQ